MFELGGAGRNLRFYPFAPPSLPRTLSRRHPELLLYFCHKVVCCFPQENNNRQIHNEGIQQQLFFQLLHETNISTIARL